MSIVVEFICKLCATRFFKRLEDLGSGIPECPVCSATRHATDAQAESEAPPDYVQLTK
ncbi:MAG: hypothetical protein AB7P50_15385 [Alphaproteobacteria bacterium]